MNFFHRNQRGGGYEENAIEGLLDWSARRFLLEHLKNANLHRKGISKIGSTDKKFRSNEEFWNIILRDYEAPPNWVELSRFQIVDWFPRTPGVFHTARAAHARKKAEKYAVEEKGIKFYTPEGKAEMIDGGLGAVRFKPIEIGDSEYWLCTATSDEYCHTGIPLAVPTHLLNALESKYSTEFKLIGQIKFLPDFLEQHFHHLYGLPQIYVLVDDIMRLPSTDLSAIKITPMVFFKGNTTEIRSSFSDAFVTYVHCHANSISELDAASEWITLYVARFDGEIITNFDQRRPTFRDAPFSLQNVMSGNIDKYQLQALHIENADIITESIQSIKAENMNMTKISVTLGDGTIIHGDLVVANSIKDSFHKASSANIPENLKALLKELALATGKMSEVLPEDKAKQVSRDLETLTAEATSKTPRRQWWQLSLDGIKEAATAVGAIGQPVLEVASKIVPLLTGAHN
jgi:hypothetical protein